MLSQILHTEGSPQVVITVTRRPRLRDTLQLLGGFALSTLMSLGAVFSLFHLDSHDSYYLGMVLPFTIFVAGATALLNLLLPWHLWGHEELRVYDGILEQDFALFGLSARRAWPVRTVKNLQRITVASLCSPPRVPQPSSLWFFGNPTLVFLDDKKKRYAGFGLTEDEALELLTTLESALSASCQSSKISAMEQTLPCSVYTIATKTLAACFLLFLVGFVRLAIHQQTEMLPLARSKGAELASQLATLKAPRESIVSDHDVSSSPTGASAVDYYRADLPYDELSRFYDEELASAGWTLHNEEIPVSSTNTAPGRHRYYCKDAYTADLTFPGADDGYDWTYSIDLSWGSHSPMSPCPKTRVSLGVA